MTLNNIFKEYSSIKDIKPIGKEISTEDKLCEVMGFYLSERHLQLLLLEYDEKQIEYEKEQEELYSDYEPVITKRTKKKKDILRYSNTIVSNIKEIIVDDISYELEESVAARVRHSDYKNTLVFAQFFEKGWKPKSIGNRNVENCFLCTAIFRGKFNHNSQIIFQFHNHQEAQIVEQPVTLEVGKEYSEKIYFTVTGTQEDHWIYINSVSVYDMYAETMKVFEDSQFIEQLTEEELIQMKTDTEKRILEACPNGKGFLSIEYESDCDQQIDFYSKEWLESQPIHKNSTTTFMVRVDKKTGKLGKYLRVTLIEEPLELDTKMVEAEIFSMHKTIESTDIVL